MEFILNPLNLLDLVSIGSLMVTLYMSNPASTATSVARIGRGARMVAITHATRSARMATRAARTGAKLGGKAAKSAAQAMFKTAKQGVGAAKQVGRSENKFTHVATEESHEHGSHKSNKSSSSLVKDGLHVEEMEEMLRRYDKVVKDFQLQIEKLQKTVEEEKNARANEVVDLRSEVENVRWRVEYEETSARANEVADLRSEVENLRWRVEYIEVTNQEYDGQECPRTDAPDVRKTAEEDHAGALGQKNPNGEERPRTDASKTAEKDHAGARAPTIPNI